MNDSSNAVMNRYKFTKRGPYFSHPDSSASLPQKMLTECMQSDIYQLFLRAYYALGKSSSYGSTDDPTSIYWALAGKLE